MQARSDREYTEGPQLTHWSDEYLIVINKPAGLLSIPDGYNAAFPHLRSVLEPYYGRLWIVHRLDRETSGLMVLARDEQTHRALNMQFDRASVTKNYHAVVEGCPLWRKKRIDLPLRKDGDRRHRTIIDHEHGKKARTDVKVFQMGKNCTIIEARPHTGRTHQIRAHLAAVGHPILGDTLYGANSGNISVTRMALHACYLCFMHPISNEQLTFCVEDPPEFSALVRGDSHTDSS